MIGSLLIFFEKNDFEINRQLFVPVKINNNEFEFAENLF